MPALQLEQADEPAASANDPAPHAAQLVTTPPADTLPDAHAVHATESFLKKPAPQRTTVHALAPTSLVSEPAAQAVQPAAPATAYVFWAHVPHALEPVPAANLPATHVLH